MGNSQSKVPSDAAMHDKALLDRLRSMQLEKKEAADEEYVHVECFEKSHDSNTEDISKLKSRSPKGLSVSEVEKWQDSLLKDPKNRYPLPSTPIPVPY